MAVLASNKLLVAKIILKREVLAANYRRFAFFRVHGRLGIPYFQLVNRIGRAIIYYKKVY